MAATRRAMLTLRHIHALRSAGLIPAARYLDAAATVRDTAFWSLWARRALLAFGAGHLLAGIVFFFAYNWADLSDIAKFAIVEGAIVATVMAALLLGIDRLHGQVAVIAASVLTGVLLAVIGQVYQTGADAYQLFAAWMLLILPWTIASQSAAQWLLWLVVCGIALALYGGQVLVPDGILADLEIATAVGLVPAVALIARELAAQAGQTWLAGRWTRLVLLFAALLLFFWPAAVVVFDWDSRGAELTCFIIAVVVAAFAYGRRLPDYAATTFVIGFAALFLIAVGLRLIDEAIGFDWDEAAPMITSTGVTILWSVLVFGLAAKLMRSLRSGTGPVNP
jgi:uncharacterized membrane protein